MNEIFHHIFSQIIEDQDVHDAARDAINLLARDTSPYTPTWHALGFVHCKLLQTDQGTLRIHIWPKKLRNDAEQKYKIHDHIFSLKSFVICGQVKNKTYELKEPEKIDKDNYSLYYVDYLESGSRLYTTGERLQPHLISETTVQQREIYNVERGIFHESLVSENELVATLVATYGHTNDVLREKINFPQHEWRELLVKVLRKMPTE
jgi:hypothetical protein